MSRNPTTWFLASNALGSPTNSSLLMEKEFVCLGVPYISESGLGGIFGGDIVQFADSSCEP